MSIPNSKTDGHFCDPGCPNLRKLYRQVFPARCTAEGPPTEALDSKQYLGSCHSHGDNKYKILRSQKCLSPAPFPAPEPEKAKMPEGCPHFTFGKFCLHMEAIRSSVQTLPCVVKQGRECPFLNGHPPAQIIVDPQSDPRQLENDFLKAAHKNQAATILALRANLEKANVELAECQKLNHQQAVLIHDYEERVAAALEALER